PCPTLLLPSDTSSTPSLYPLSLHDALPIFGHASSKSKRFYPWTLKNGEYCVHTARKHVAILSRIKQLRVRRKRRNQPYSQSTDRDRKSTRLNSSHVSISYAVFCLKKKTKNI